jgi:putative superfamily III holin-X
MGELFKELSEDVSALVRQELRLAQAEMTEKGRKAGVAAGMLAGAGVAALLALGTLTACLVAVLATGMDVWLAALIVTVVYGAGAGTLATYGRSRVSDAGPTAPVQTVETVKENAQWAKTQLSSEKR